MRGEEFVFELMGSIGEEDSSVDVDRMQRMSDESM